MPWFALESADAGFIDTAPHVFRYEKHFAAPPETSPSCTAADQNVICR